MQVHDPIIITDRDRLLRAWQDCMELIRDFQLYAREVEDKELSRLFAQGAEEIGYRSAAFHDALMEMETK